MDFVDQLTFMQLFNAFFGTALVVGIVVAIIVNRQSDKICAAAKEQRDHAEEIANAVAAIEKHYRLSQVTTYRLSSRRHHHKLNEDDDTSKLAHS